MNPLNNFNQEAVNQMLPPTVTRPTNYSNFAPPVMMNSNVSIVKSPQNKKISLINSINNSIQKQQNAGERSINGMNNPLNVYLGESSVQPNKFTPLIRLNQGERSAPRQLNPNPIPNPNTNKPLSSRMDSISQYFNGQQV